MLSLTAPVMNGFSLGGGGGGGEYLYKDDPLATPFLTEYTDTAGSAFHIRPGKRVVEFYSPYCVSRRERPRNFGQIYLVSSRVRVYVSLSCNDCTLLQQ